MRRTLLRALPSLLCCIGATAPSFADVTLEPLGAYSTGLYDQVAAEIGAYDPVSQRAFVSNSATNAIDVLDLHDPTSIQLVLSIPLADFGAGPNSVAFSRGIGAVGCTGDPKTAPGRVVFFDSDGNILGNVVAGALPDCLTFTPNGKQLLVANEGEPSDDYTVDPEGTISVIDLSISSTGALETNVRTADFASYNDRKKQLQSKGIRIYGPTVNVIVLPDGTEEHEVIEGGASVAQDIEPEFIAVTADSQTAWVTLQENNAFAIVDLQTASVKDIVPLGYKRHSLPGNTLDASDRDSIVNNQQLWPVLGMYLPDGVAAFQVDGKNYTITANEGDTRDWDGFSEEERVGGLLLGGSLAQIPDLQKNQNLGRLKVTNSPPDGKQAGAGPEGEDVYKKLYSFGGRSISIWDDHGRLVFDSGNQLELITAEALGDDFNSDNTVSPSGDSRSDDKGPEPEGIVVGRVDKSLYAFVGLERPGGVVIYDISDPRKPRFVDYVNRRDFSVEFDIGACADCAGDCEDSCVDDCTSCKEACAACEACPEGEDCSEQCATCTECEASFTCDECTADCPSVAVCAADCKDACEGENCPRPGVAGRDPLDLGPEGLVFVPAEASPLGFGPLLIVTNEVSGTTAVFQVVAH